MDTDLTVKECESRILVYKLLLASGVGVINLSRVEHYALNNVSCKVSALTTPEHEMVDDLRSKYAAQMGDKP